MIWLILIIVVVFLIASALPLIRQIADEKQQRKLLPPEIDDEHIERERFHDDDEDV